MMCKLENGCPIPPPKNGYLSNGTAVSNLDTYLENNTEIASAEGYYPLQDSTPPSERAVCSYAVVDGVIVQTWSTAESEGDE